MPCRSSRHLLGGLSRSFGPGGVAQHTVLDALPRRCHVNLWLGFRGQPHELLADVFALQHADKRARGVGDTLTDRLTVL